MTCEPLWFHRLIWALMTGSWSMRASIWVGPWIVVLAGSW